MFEIGDKVTCRRNKHSRISGMTVNLTKGGEYNVTNTRLAEVEVVNDIGEHMFYAGSRFYPLNKVIVE